MLTGCEFGTDPCKSSPDACSPNTFAHPSPEQPPEPPHRTGALSASGGLHPWQGAGAGHGAGGAVGSTPLCPKPCRCPWPKQGGGGGGTARYGSTHSPTVPTLLGGGGATWGPHPRSTHGCPYPPRTQRTCVCTPPHEAPKAPMGERTPGCPSPQEGGGQGAPPPAPPPRRSAVQVSGPAGARGGAQSSGGRPGTAAGGGCRVVPATPPRPLPALPSRPIPSSEGQGGPLPRGEPRGCPRVGTSSGPGPQVHGWLQPLVSRPFVTRTVGARSRRWPWEGAGALQELLWL